MTIEINIADMELLDNSKVYDVRIYYGSTFEYVLTLPCVTEKDAIDLRDKIAEAITEHTNELVNYG